MIAPTTPFDDQALRWSVERRLAFIETRLTWEGRINRLDLVSRFGISPNQATADLKRFEAGNPGALVYDTRVRTYRAGPGLALATASMASDLLRDLRLIAEGVQAPEEGALAAPPPTEVAEPPVRVAAPDLLEVVVAAIRERREMSADYQSFSSPAPGRRRLEPHALVFDGFRWHARALDIEENRFRDFVLGRLSRAELGEAARSSAADDRDWDERLELTIVAHPRLAPHQKSAIERDYGMEDGRLVLRPRAAVAWYVKRRLGLTEGHQDRRPEEQHIVLVGEATIAGDG